MTTLAIAEAKIKLAWREKYLTDGTNERGLSSPRGAYRGYWLSPRLAPDTWLRLIIDPYTPGHVVDKDQFAVLADRTTGFSLSVRETTDVEFNCGGVGGLFPVGGVDETWYVYIEATYTPNVVTVANYRVEKTDPHLIASPNYDPNAVILGVIPMPAGAVIFPAFSPLDPMYARRCIPSPTARQLVADYVDGDEPWGLFDGLSKWCLGTGTDGRVFGEPTLDPYTLVAATKFQLSGSFYVGRENAFDVAGQYFVALNALGPALLTGTGRGRIIVSSVVLQSDGLTQLNPFADADSEGFYSNPWLQLGFSDCPPDVSYTGNLNVLCFKKKTLLTLENDPASTFPVGCQKVPEHATNVVAKNQAGAPDSLAGVTVTAQLLELLGLVNDRIETIHNDATPGNWVLLWRSHNITLDANVTKQTSSLYFGDKGLALLHGGYIKIADGDVYAGTGAAGDDVSILYLRSGGTGGLTFGVKSGPVSPPAHWDIETGWDMYSDQTNLLSLVGGPLAPYGGVLWAPDAFPDAFSTIVASAWRKHDETSPVAATPQCRRYFKQGGVLYAVNCYLDSVGPDMWLGDQLAFPAFVWRLDNNGLYLCKMHEDNVTTAPGAPWADGAWDSQWKLGLDMGGGDASIACMQVEGKLYEVVRFGWRGHIRSTDPAPPDPDPYEFTVMDVCNFRNRWGAAPVAGDFTLSNVYLDGIDGIVGAFFDLGAAGLDTYIQDIDNWGFRVQFTGTTAPVVNFDSRYRYDAQAIIES